MKKKYQADEKGRSMIEAIAYITILILLSASVTAAVNRGYTKFRVGRILQEVTDLKKVVSQRWMAAADYSGVKWQTLVDEKILPPALNRKKHSFSGGVDIGPDSDVENYWIKFDNLPPDACTELALKPWLTNDGSDLNYLKVNNKVWCWPYSVKQNCDFELPVKAADVIKGCKTDWDNTITWTFN